MTRKRLSEPEGYEFLTALGIPVPDYRVVQSGEEAEKSADTLGYPLVMKVVSDQVVHKTDAGGVIRGIKTPADASRAYTTILSNTRQHMPGAVISGVIIEREMPQGLELIIGGKTDPTFGKVLTFGIGGIYVELLHNVSIRVLPLETEEIAEMIREIRGYPLIHGYRNNPPLDEDLLVSVLDTVARDFYSSGTVEEFDINPLILYEKGICAVDARIYIDTPVRPSRVSDPFGISPDLFSPRSIAVIGASADPKKIGYAILRNLLPFPGELYVVNPNHPEILGKKAYPQIAAIPGSIDLAIVAVPAKMVNGIIRELGENKVPLVIIVSSGFREAGKDGEALEREVIETAKQYGTRIIGPNTLGVMFPRKGINTTFDPLTPRQGHIGFISQSGAIITTIVDWSIPEHLGFSAVISVGNQVDLGFLDYLCLLDHDPDTRAIIMYIEEILDGPGFMRLVSDITRRKPVIALKSGSSARGKIAASSHTGSLAGSYEVYEAAFRQSGVIPVESLREAFDVAELIASEGYPKGNRAIVVTTAGGFAVLASDYAERYGITLVELSESLTAEFDSLLPPNWSHENPVDIIGDGGAERYARTFDILIRHQEEWDIAIVIAVPSAVLDAGHLALEIARFSKSTRKMIVGSMMGGDSMKRGIRLLREEGIPNYPDIQEAFRAVGRAVYGTFNHPATHHPPPAPGYLSPCQRFHR